VNALPKLRALARETADQASDVKSVPATVGNPIALPNRETRATAEACGKKRRFYRPLPTQFRHNRFDYRQIAREGDAAIYEQRWTGYAEASITYELIHIRRREGFEIAGRLVEPAEVYPKSEAWGGVDGFTFTDKDVAFEKLREIGG